MRDAVPQIKYEYVIDYMHHRVGIVHQADHVGVLARQKDIARALVTRARLHVVATGEVSMCGRLAR